MTFTEKNKKFKRMMKKNVPNADCNRSKKKMVKFTYIFAL